MKPPSDLASPRGIRQRLRELERGAKKGLGQHFLVDRDALRNMVAAAQITKGDTVLEVGPGLGILTRELIKEAGRVIAVEIDPQLARSLQEELQNAGNIQVICADILSLDLSQVFSGAGSYKVVAALPYFIASRILRYFLEAPVKPSLIVITVQREVGQNIAAKPGDTTLLSIAVQLYGKPQIVEYLSPWSFYPRPKVDSAIVRIEVYPEPAFPVRDTNAFFSIVRAGFSSRRKQLHNALALGLGVPQSDSHRWLTAAGIEPMRRAQTLSLEEWFRLYQVWSQEQPNHADQKSIRQD